MPQRYRQRPYVPAKDPLTAIPPSRHPFQFWVMFAMVLSGAGNFFAEGSEVLSEGLPAVSHKVWALTALIGGALAIIGAWWPDRITGLLMERIALFSIGIACPVYALVVYSVSGTTGLIAISLTASVGVACLWRTIHVSRELKVLRLFVARSYRR